MNDISVKKPARLKSLKRFSKRLLKGKAFRRGEFGTSLLDMTVRGFYNQQKGRPPGSNPSPKKLEILPSSAAAAGTADRIRIYIGSEAAQHRGERVLLWSILKHHNPAMHYEIYVMKDLAGFDRSKWKTGFTAYRYAIPEFAGFEGRAIYNDVDQIYLRDPANLLGEEMSGAAVLAVDSSDTSVMLMDCGLLEDIWTIDAIHTTPEIRLHAGMLERVRKANLIADLPGYWNARDHEYEEGASSLLHYTILHTQPWRPFPKELRYRKNTQSLPWHRLEEDADQKGFALHWKTDSERSYSDMRPYFTVND
jgi:hypothetical protein